MTPLGALLREQIAAEGPMTVERYMALCLGHPRHGYYVTRDPLGPGGDFTTAPEISQMFGELLGLWAAAVWDASGRPDPFVLAELGPGRGTLMADALRATRVVPGFHAAARLHLVETSPVLRAAQAERLRGRPVAPTWHARWEDVPDGPAIVLANEFLDALPIRQFVARSGRWHERLVGLGADGGLVFGLAAEPERDGMAAPARDGTVLEVAPAAADLARDLGRRLAASGGAALFVDYGHARSAPGDTLQAVRRHAFDDPLAAPGEADLTAHVDFAAFARAAAAAGAGSHGPVGQGRFLLDLGIAERAARLRTGASAADAAKVDAGLARLTGEGAAAMGGLFKVLGLSHPALALPGLPAAGASTRTMAC